MTRRGFIGMLLIALCGAGGGAWTAASLTKPKPVRARFWRPVEPRG